MASVFSCLWGMYSSWNHTPLHTTHHTPLHTIPHHTPHHTASHTTPHHNTLHHTAPHHTASHTIPHRITHHTTLHHTKHHTTPVKPSAWIYSMGDISVHLKDWMPGGESIKTGWTGWGTPASGLKLHNDSVYHYYKMLQKLCTKIKNIGPY